MLSTIQWVSTPLFSLHVISLSSHCLSFSLWISMEMRALPLSFPSFFSTGVDVNEAFFSPLSLSFVLSNRGTQCFLIHLWKLGYTSVSFLSLCLAAILENVPFLFGHALDCRSERVCWLMRVNFYSRVQVCACLCLCVCLSVLTDEGNSVERSAVVSTGAVGSSVRSLCMSVCTPCRRIKSSLPRVPHIKILI